MTPVTGTEARVGVAGLQALVEAVFQRCGMDEGAAALLADSLVTADLRGVHSHGVLRVPEYVHKLTQGGVDPRGRPRVVHDGGACLLVDGGNSMGVFGAHFAMERVIERARSTGIAAAAIRGSNHCGALAYYAMQALPHDLIGLATTNALPTMAPWGGAERLLGINPLAAAVPAGEELPLVFDAAFSGCSHGKIRVYQQKGLALPEGWALDDQGRPTTDPAAALEGLLVPIGGFKGVGLALLMGVLSALLSGASYGTELGDLRAGPRPGQDGHFVCAIRIAAFAEVSRFKARVDGAIRQLRACRRAPGCDRIYVPGEPEFLHEQRARREGIPLTPTTLAELHRVAAELGVESPARVRLTGGADPVGAGG
jgi:LDH2 family malate/lactate/ureidoglycolate dehydrogenase